MSNIMQFYPNETAAINQTRIEIAMALRPKGIIKLVAAMMVFAFLALLQQLMIAVEIALRIAFRPRRRHGRRRRVVGMRLLDLPRN